MLNREGAVSNKEAAPILFMAYVRLGVEEATAESDACKIEHVLSDDTFNALKKHIK